MNATNQASQADAASIAGVVYVADVDLARRYSVSRQTVWGWVRSGVLPKPVRLSDRCTRWRLSEVIERDAAREAARGAA